MGESKKDKPPIPPWAWGFVVACVTIPIAAIGGAIPGALGVGGAAACVGIARQLEKPIVGRVLFCTAISTVCWGLYIGLILILTPAPAVATTENSLVHPEAASVASTAPDLSDEALRREIYADAYRISVKIDRAVERRAETITKGQNTQVADKQIEHLEGMNEKHIEFLLRFQKITPEQLGEIIDEGDATGWLKE